jgi:hypothetical protein
VRQQQQQQQQQRRQRCHGIRAGGSSRKWLLTQTYTGTVTDCRHFLVALTSALTARVPNQTSRCMFVGMATCSPTHGVLYACADTCTLQTAAVLPTCLNNRTAGRRCMLRQPTAAPLQRGHCWSMEQMWKPQTR